MSDPFDYAIEEPPSHVKDAVRLNASFKHGPLKDNPLKKSLQPVCASQEKIYFGKMPWSVRFFALVHGRLPFSYPEEF